jgi:hypothetical protein
LSFVWWPYLISRASQLSAEPLRAAAVAGLEIIAVAFIISLFFLVYGVFPDVNVYIAYVVNPGNCKSEKISQIFSFNGQSMGIVIFPLTGG